MKPPHPLLQKPLSRTLQGLSGELSEVYAEVGSIQRRLGTAAELPGDLETARNLMHRYANAFTAYSSLRSLGLSVAQEQATESTVLVAG